MPTDDDGASSSVVHAPICREARLDFGLRENVCEAQTWRNRDDEKCHPRPATGRRAET
jgi:hypothetical protein